MSCNRIATLGAIVGPLAALKELREALVGGNPCTADDPATTAAGDEWWRVVRDGLGQLHYVDDAPTGRGPKSLTSISSGPAADRLRLATVVLNQAEEKAECDPPMTQTCSGPLLLWRLAWSKFSRSLSAPE